MFITLLIVTLVIALATSLLLMRLFDRMIRKILDRLVSAELIEAWNRYLSFAVVVVGVSGGVRIWSLEKYVTAYAEEGEPVLLNADRWILAGYWRCTARSSARCRASRGFSWCSSSLPLSPTSSCGASSCGGRVGCRRAGRRIDRRTRTAALSFGPRSRRGVFRLARVATGHRSLLFPARRAAGLRPVYPAVSPESAGESPGESGRRGGASLPESMPNGALSMRFRHRIHEITTE